MTRLYDEVKERLAVIEDMYDVIRVVDPVSKDIVIIKDDKIERLKGTCYGFWKRNMICNNCISIRAFIEDSTFAKIESNEDNSIFVIAIPVVINDNRYVVEMLKNINKSGKMFNSNNIIVKKFNEKIIRDELIDLLNDFYESEGKKINVETKNNFIEIDDVKLSKLEKKIDELRDTLNELCKLPDQIGKDKQILNTSQALDELIVEYMKEL